MRMELFKINDFTECNILERKNRFVVIVDINGRISEVHINNTGRLKGLLIRGKRGFCYKINGKKLKNRLFSVVFNNTGIIIDTSIHMKAFEKIVEKGLLKEFKGYNLKRNHRKGSSVFDFLIYKDNKKIIVELKSAVLENGQFASYPDAPTRRGERHFEELISLKRRGENTMIVFASSVYKTKGFKPNSKISPRIDSLLKIALKEGVILKSFNVLFEPSEGRVFLDKLNLPVLI